MAEQSRAVPPISLGSVVDAFAHAPGLLAQLVQQFESSLHVQAAELESFIATGDLISTIQSSHRLAGSGAMFGAAGLAAICRQIESAARSGNLDAVQDLQASLAIEAQRVLNAIALCAERGASTRS